MSNRKHSSASVARMTLGELDAEIEARSSEIEVLKRARGVLERDLAGQQCGEEESEHACGGALWSRWCRRCGFVLIRCDQHGGLRAAAVAIATHVSRAHPTPTKTRRSNHQNGES